MDKRKIAYLIIGLTAVFALVMFILFMSKTTTIDKSLPIDTNIFSHYGGIVGGISAALLSLASVLLIIQSLDSQEQQRKDDKEEEDKNKIHNRVETRAFEYLKLHRDNVIEFQSKGKTGRPVLVGIFDEFYELYEKVKSHFPFDKSGLSTEADYRKQCAKIAYRITYFGLGNNSTDKLTNYIRQTVGTQFYDETFYPNYLKSEINNHKKRKEENKTKPRKERLYLDYDGHQSRLGHMFRHLYQSIKYINNQKTDLFDYQTKYGLTKALRAQLSNFEQALLFINSISEFGEAWELSRNDDNYKLITKYNLIKNIPPDLIGDLNPKDYYPNVYYEFDQSKTAERNRIESTYS